MTVQQARKILGSSSDKFSDDIINDFIYTAEMLKTLYYEFTRESDTHGLCHNKSNNNDKTKSSCLH